MYSFSDILSYCETQQVFEISPELYVVELSKSCGDASAYRQVHISSLSATSRKFK